MGGVASSRARLGTGIALLCAALAGPGSAGAQSTGTTLAGTAPAPALRTGGRIAFEIGPTDGPVRVDGRLDEPAWAGATSIPLPWEVDPAENAPARFETDCRLTYDADNLYLGCRAHDPDPGTIRAYVSDRDRIQAHDRVVLTLDPFDDQRRAFRFSVSALGVQADEIVAQQGAGGPNQGQEGPIVDASWDAIWDAAGSIGDGGYVVEAAVPFQSLRFPGGDGPRTWGISLSRIRPRSSMVETRSVPWDRDNACLLCQVNAVTGFEGIRPGGTVQLTPTLTASRVDVAGVGPESGLVRGPADADVGLDALWSVTSDLTLNATLNPDFSQVEADAAQLSVNNRFALFYPEKRPFFLEGADVFGTLIQAVFTRSIADPVAGAKVSGKSGPNALGVLVARDRVNNLLLPASQFSEEATLDAGVTTTVGRFRRDLGATSTFGALVTTREGSGYHNRVGGVDGFWRPHPSLSLQLQALRSDTRYPDAVTSVHDQPTGAFGGTAVAASSSWSSRRWLSNVDLRWIQPDFRADAGFLTQSGVRGGSANLSRRVLGDGDGWFNELRFTAGVWRNEDFEGHPLTSGIWFGSVYRGPLQSRLAIFPNIAQREHVGDRTFSGLYQVYVDGGIQPSGSVGLTLNGDFGTGVDYANERPGRQVRVSPQLQLRLGRHVEASVQHTLQRLTFEGEQVFLANLGQLRTVYSFSPRSFVRTVVQVTHTRRNPDLYVRAVDRRSTSVFAQLLYAYKLNPQTVFFLGYSEGRDGRLGPEGARDPLARSDRTFFLKLGWALRP